jgi:hypothetical protein
MFSCHDAFSMRSASIAKGASFGATSMTRIVISNSDTMLAALLAKHTRRNFVAPSISGEKKFIGSK